MRNIGRRIAELRLQEKNWTQAQLAEAIGHENTQYVQAIEGGVPNIEIATLVKIANALELDDLQQLMRPPDDASPRRPGRPRKQATDAALRATEPRARGTARKP
jgi:transcriptional regulator with XRE-family HTH domain